MMELVLLSPPNCLVDWYQFAYVPESNWLQLTRRMNGVLKARTFSSFFFKPLKQETHQLVVYAKHRTTNIRPIAVGGGIFGRFFERR